MPFTKVSAILKEADTHHTSAIAFNCVDYTTASSVVHAAEAVGKPVIVMLYPEHSYKNRFCSLEGFASMVKSLADKASIPVGLHLDHCSDYAYIISAVKAGFPSVMYDGSMLPVEENIVNTKKVVETAHILGAEVEAELGHVGFASTKTDQFNEDMYTRADVAARFCAETGVDSVAVAVGSAHGFYKTAPKLDLGRLEEINAATDTPLVMHGGSGIPSDQVALAFEKGINKFNVGTEFFHLYHTTLHEFYKQHGTEGDFFDIPVYVQKRLQEYLVKKLELCRM